VLLTFFDTMPSAPSRQAWAKTTDTVITVKGILIRLSGEGVYCSHERVLEAKTSVKPARYGAPLRAWGLTPAPASNQGSPCDRRHDVAQQPMAIAGSKGFPVFRTPKHSTNSLRIAATTICLGLRRPRAFNRVTSATIAGLYRMADMAGM
jgi:hypothetical protein